MADIDMTDADWSIIDVLQEGRNNSPNISERTGYTRQYITERLVRMREHGVVSNIGSGIYELNPEEVPDND